ncbi:MAG TPA: hypothetical protein VEC12_07695, partial [Bacteroidia bacterium]|nr:hypothetical protein [Bacteroidia bacterium]
WSSTILLSMVDIGAVAAFRFTNDSAEEIPTVQLQDIFSPGIFYSLGFPNSPVSLNIGYQMGPLLRKVTVQSNQYGQSYSRFSIALCVDIPLLNFYTRSR